MKIACVSDTHGRLNLEWPKADVLIIAGDILPNFKEDKESDGFLQSIYLEETLRPLVSTLANEIYDYIVFVPGNHDRVFEVHKERALDALAGIENFSVLINEGVFVNNKLFWGSPWTPWFYGNRWSFNLPEDKAKVHKVSKAVWSLIPTKTDILITHGPPFSVLDKVDGSERGCPHLASEVFKRVKPKLHVFGHIHAGSGQTEQSGIKFVNAAICNDFLEKKNSIRTVEI